MFVTQADSAQELAQALSDSLLVVQDSGSAPAGCRFDTDHFVFSIPFSELEGTQKLYAIRLDWVQQRAYLGNGTTGYSEIVGAIQQSLTGRGLSTLFQLPDKISSSLPIPNNLKAGRLNQNDRDYAAHLKITTCFFCFDNLSASYKCATEYHHEVSSQNGSIGPVFTWGPSATVCVANTNDAGPGEYEFQHPNYQLRDIIYDRASGWTDFGYKALNGKAKGASGGIAFAGALVYEEGAASSFDDAGHLVVNLPVAVEGQLPETMEYSCWLDADAIKVDFQDGHLILVDGGGRSSAILQPTVELAEILEHGQEGVDLTARLIVNTPANASITNRPARDLLQDGTLSGPFAEQLKNR